MISLIVPAHNEAAMLPRTLRSLHEAARAAGEEYEIVVVDDASTDQTAAIAQSMGARVIPVNKRQISAVRNAGAAAARGEILMFVDADTQLPARTLKSAINSIRRGAVGGGAVVRFDSRLPIWGWIFIGAFEAVWIVIGWAAGCFVFARRDAFERIGGFDERFFAAEEIYISRALKRVGKFVILHQPVITSARKFRMYSGREVLRAAGKLLRRGPGGWQSREGMELWYDGKRE